MKSKNIEKQATCLKEYEALIPKLGTFLNNLVPVVDKSLTSAGIKLHGLESRVKTRESVEKKIGRFLSHPNPLQNITDLVGLRVITNYPDDVDIVCQALAATFDVLQKVDKRANQKPDKFGYQSVHMIVRITPDRAKSDEWRRYSHTVVEIQVRSILQHAWAMVSRSLIYRREREVPLKLRRKLNRLVGLFEIADDYFVQLRTEQESLLGDTRTAISPDIEVNLVSLTRVFRDPSFRHAIQTIASAAKIQIDPKPHSECWRRLAAVCSLLGIATTDKLHARVVDLPLEDVARFSDCLNYYEPPIYCEPL